MSNLEYHELAWTEDNIPVSKAFDDPFYSRRDGRAETQYVFLGGNGLPGRWLDTNRFDIAELGFGTGLNFLETWQTWCATRQDGQHLFYTAFEKYPLSAHDIERALSGWRDLMPRCKQLIEVWDIETRLGEIWQLDPQTSLQIVPGAAESSVSGWSGLADAWFLDGFSPAKNPEMWGERLLADVFNHTRAGGTFATYTAAGWVRRNLEAAGFQVEKRPGHGGKREMMLGKRASG
ncbi:MAG: tRNA (5-methylaminomethyl-2-thiouridine)(34)-methyltransferase MnmD [Filomicrobium sp.]